MAREKFSATQAIRVLKQHGVAFSLHPYRYEERGGTAVAARELNVNEHLVIKTLVMEDERGGPLLVLMHGDKEVSAKGLARAVGVKTVRPCEPRLAHKHTGYVAGGISPFGPGRPLRVFVEASIMNLPRIYINAGRRGLLAEISPEDLKKVLDIIPVSVAL